MTARVEVDQGDLTRLVTALNAEADGKGLRRDLVAGLKAAVEPAARQAQASILSMPTGGAAQPGGLVRETGSLRTAVAAAVTTQVRTSGSRAGVFGIAGKTGMPRGFVNAPKRLNSARWRHPVLGTGQWVWQVGKPRWFDDPMDAARPAAQAAAQQALDAVADRIQQRTR